MGDIIAGMASVKEICSKENKKATIYLDVTGGTNCNDPLLNKIILEQSHGLGLKFCESGFKFLEPLLLAQDYIKEVKHYDGSKVDYNLNRFRIGFCSKEIAKKTNQNLMFLQQDACGLEFGWKNSWLDAPTKSFQKKMVIARSCRCHSSHTFFCAFEKEIGEKAYFLGTDLEHKAFCEVIRFHPERFPVDSALDAAVLLKSSDVIIANSSLFFWIAVGLGKKVIHELPLNIPTTYFPGVKEIKYIQGGKVFG